MSSNRQDGLLEGVEAQKAVGIGKGEQLVGRVEIEGIALELSGCFLYDHGLEGLS